MLDFMDFSVALKACKTWGGRNYECIIIHHHHRHHYRCALSLHYHCAYCCALSLSASSLSSVYKDIYPNVVQTMEDLESQDC